MKNLIKTITALAVLTFSHLSFGQETSGIAARGSVVTFSATADGTPAPTFQWYKDGTAIEGATSATLTIQSFQEANVGRYTVEASNQLGKALSDGYTLTFGVPPTKPVIKVVSDTSGSVTVLVPQDATVIRQPSTTTNPGAPVATKASRAKQ